MAATLRRGAAERPGGQPRRNRGEEQGLSDEEIAFYGALAENESAVQVMGDDKLRVIAHELLVSLRENESVDWAHRESARARLRVLVKRILRKYGYPPDLQDAAVQTVLQQAEAWSSGWSVCKGADCSTERPPVGLQALSRLRGKSGWYCQIPPKERTAQQGGAMNQRAPGRRKAAETVRPSSTRML